MRPPTGNAFVSSCLAEFQFYLPLHVPDREIPHSCFDLRVCQPAGLHCPRSPQPDCGRPGRGYICHYSHSPRCDRALSIGEALIAQKKSLVVPLATILTCVPLRGTPSLFTFVIIHIRHAVTRLFPSVRRSSLKTQVVSSRWLLSRRASPYGERLRLFTFVIIYIHHAVTRLFPSVRRTSHKAQVF